MEELVLVTKDENGIQSVNARNLYNALCVKRDFSTWIKSRIKKYQFIDGEDFTILLTKSGEQVHGGHNSKEYLISLDMAKELSMVENNEAGRKIRKYFIECEKQLKKRIELERENHIKLIECEKEKLRSLVNNREKMLGEAITELSKRASVSEFGDISKSNGRYKTKYRLQTYYVINTQTQ